LHGSAFIAATAADLAKRPPFRLGDTLVVPASREVRGPGGEAAIEPRVMQVLLALVDAAGAVVTRDELIRTCWNNQIVGEDAINRAVAELRKVARTLAGGGFAVETIPRTGYRLIGATAAIAAGQGSPPSDAKEQDSPRRWGRRALVGGVAVAGLAAFGGLGAWRFTQDRAGRRVADLSDRARLATTSDTPEGYARGAALLREAVALRPGDARLWGRLSVALRASGDFVSPAQTAAIVQECELAAARALALDPRQPEARVTLALLRPTYGDWLMVERKLRAVLADDPANDDVLGPLALLLMSVGRGGEAFATNEAVAAREPLSPVYQYRRTYQLWTVGRQGDADRTIDRAIELWPRHPGVWLARIWLTAFTGRAEAAMAQIEDVEARPPAISKEVISVLRLSMKALASRDPAAVEAAVQANLAAASAGPSGSINAIMILTALERLDDAFTVARGYLLRQGPSIMPLGYGPTQTPVSDQRHRKTQMLFIPVTAPLRADPRFIDLCRGCGLADYWRQSGHWADFLGSRQV
jgi:DNA-binding winged helix-turn-helix (wHTH) protein/Flp pilus assembly protein TadD